MFSVFRRSYLANRERNRVNKIDIRSNMFRSSTLKSNFVKLSNLLFSFFLFVFNYFFNFSTKAAFCMTNFTTNKSKTDKSNFNQLEHVFPFSHSDKSKPSFQVYFIVEYSQISNLAAGKLQALQRKPSRQVAVVCMLLFWSVSVHRQLAFGLSYNYADTLSR